MSAIRTMLEACAPGFRIEEKLHRNWVRYKGKTFPGLPKGEHGKGDPEIEIGHVRKLIRFLGIDQSCAEKHLPTLRRRGAKAE